MALTVAKKAVRCGYDLVARPDTQGHQSQQQSIAPGSAADSVLRSAVGGDLLLQGLHLATQNECVRVENPAQCGLYFGPESRVLFAKIK